MYLWSKIMEAIIKATEQGVVIGLKGLGEPVPRREIDQLRLQKPETFNLFLLALKDLQEDDPKKLMGYFQVAGIVAMALYSFFPLRPKHRYPWSPQSQMERRRLAKQRRGQHVFLRMLRSQYPYISNLASSVSGYV